MAAATETSAQIVILDSDEKVEAYSVEHASIIRPDGLNELNLNVPRGENCLTLRKCTGSVGEEMVREIIMNQALISQGADNMWCFTGLEDEALNYDEEKELDEGEIVNKPLGAKLDVSIGQGRETVANKMRSFGVLQELIPRMIQWDQTSDMGGAEIGDPVYS
ncbi:hypothetical protein NDU88_006644 [Pleurodeles waltl]|uniref:Uncharacterized protein n=1 Tax=Pleurodeles waltl TaxID=8319 RepID=A0AAV7RN22_PLEWA|nr:hypothetical protein NDU88_006644 [Pleurodeles waltl]